MQPLIALDFASQETWEDAKHALTLLVSPSQWKGSEAQTAVRKFFSDTTYATPQGTTLHTALFFSGRLALKTLLTALRLPKGSGVAVQGFTCAAVTLPILSCGLTIHYVDINPKDFSMDSNHLQSIHNLPIKVLILQHTFGITPAHREAIITYCATHDIFLIEDLAHGCIPQSLAAPQLGNRYCALVSFGRSKLFSSVFGAGIVTPDIALYTQLENAISKLQEAPKLLVIRCLLYKIMAPFIKRWYGMGGKVLHRIALYARLFPPEITAREKSGQYDSAYAYAYPEILAHTLTVQLHRHTETIKRIRQSIGEYQKYMPHIHQYPSLPLNRLPVLAKDSAQRSHILRHFRMHNILLGTWYTQPVGPERLDLASMHYQTGSCPVSEDITSRIINLPVCIHQTVASQIGSMLPSLLTHS